MIKSDYPERQQPEFRAEDTRREAYALYNRYINPPKTPLASITSEEAVEQAYKLFVAHQLYG